MCSHNGSWDVDKLLSKYFDKQQEYLKDAGVLDVPAKVPPHGPNDQVGESLSATFAHRLLLTFLSLSLSECLVCFDTVPFSKTYALRCGHQYYCRDCWKNYLQEKTNNAVGTAVVLRYDMIEHLWAVDSRSCVQ
jgi:hypothetical protein